MKVKGDPFPLLNTAEKTLSMCLITNNFEDTLSFYQNKKKDREISVSKISLKFGNHNLKIPMVLLFIFKRQKKF